MSKNKQIIFDAPAVAPPLEERVKDAYFEGFSDARHDTAAISTDRDDVAPWWASSYAKRGLDALETPAPPVAAVPPSLGWCLCGLPATTTRPVLVEGFSLPVCERHGVVTAVPPQEEGLRALRDEMLTGPCSAYPDVKRWRRLVDAMLTKPAVAAVEGEPRSAQLVADILAEYADDLTKEACDRCDNCGQNIMCGFHSVLSLLQRHTLTTAEIARGAAHGAKLTDEQRGFCRFCGASIPHRVGEGRCDTCAHHAHGVGIPNP